MRFAIIFFLLFSNFAIAEPIYHEKKYPKGDGSFPAVILLHTSGGYKSDAYINDRGEFFLKEGFAIYAPDFFKRHGITPKTRLKTFTQFRKNIEQELLEIVELVKKDPKVNPNNVFAVGFSNGGFWATYLSSTGKINAASSHYGVWQFGGPKNLTKGYPVKYIKKECSPLLVLHPEKDVVQKYKFVKPEIDRIKEELKVNEDKIQSYKIKCIFVKDETNSLITFVGLDGLIKLEDESLDLDKIFKLISAMPMANF